MPSVTVHFADNASVRDAKFCVSYIERQLLHNLLKITSAETKFPALVINRLCKYIFAIVRLS